MEFKHLEEVMHRNINDTIDAKHNLSYEEMKCISEAVDVLKDIETIRAMRMYGGGESEYYPESFADRVHMGGMSGIRGRSPMTGRFVSRDGYPMNDTSYTMAYNSNEGGTMAQLQRMRDNAKNEHERMEMEKLLNFAKNNLDNY
jgi:hypothetical protein